MFNNIIRDGGASERRRERASKLSCQADYVVSERAHSISANYNQEVRVAIGGLTHEACLHALTERATEEEAYDYAVEVGWREYLANCKPPLSVEPVGGLTERLLERCIKFKPVEGLDHMTPPTEIVSFDFEPMHESNADPILVCAVRELEEVQREFMCINTHGFSYDDHMTAENSIRRLGDAFNVVNRLMNTKKAEYFGQHGIAPGSRVHGVHARVVTEHKLIKKHINSIDALAAFHNVSKLKSIVLTEKLVDACPSNKKLYKASNFACLNGSSPIFQGQYYHYELKTLIECVPNFVKLSCSPENDLFVRHVTTDNVYINYRNMLLFLANGADVNTVNKDDVPLVGLVKEGLLVDILVDQGADINKRFDERTVLFQNSPLLKYFLANGADVHALNAAGQTAIFHHINNPEALDLLVGRGADINHVDDLGFTVLFYDASLDARKSLIKHKADVNRVDATGKTMMHYATTGPEAVFLLENGFDMSRVDLASLRPDVAKAIPKK